MHLVDSIKENRGLYSLKEAATYARVAPMTLQRWLFGTKTTAALRASEIDPAEGRYVTFIEFIEAAAIGELRLKNIPLQRIRQAIDTAKKHYGIEHPFAHEKHWCYTVGKDLFITLDEKSIAGLSGKDRHQLSSRPLLEAYMKNIEFDSEHMAAAFTAYRYGQSAIKMTPTKLFGEPILERSGYPALTLWNAANEEGSIELAAKNYDVEVEEVEAACEYWKSLQAA
jgi:uncharacterized protein (DUF433 family)